MPIVSAVRVRMHESDPGLVSCLRVLDGPAGRLVDCVGPRDGCTLRRISRGQHLEKGTRRDQLAVRAIDDIEEAVLRRLHRYLARPSINREVREHDGLRRGVVPGLARRGLVVPPVCPVFASSATIDARKRLSPPPGERICWFHGEPFPAPTSSWSNSGSYTIASQAVPPPPPAHHSPFHVCAARAITGSEAAPSGPFAGSPGTGIEAPLERPGVRVVRGDIAADAELGAAVANVNEAVGGAWCAGDGVGLGLIDGHRLPRHRPGRGVESDETAVDNPDEDLAAIDRDAAVHDIATGPGADRAIHLRIVHPEASARSSVDRVHDAPGRRDVHHAIDDERRRLGPAVHREVV